jgi:predicted ATPase
MPTTPDVTPPDYNTAIGQARLLIPDTEQLGDTPSYLFSDPQIQAFLSLYANNVKRAAAQAKLVLATSEALINKVIKTYDFQTDGAKLGAELRAQAAELRAEADRDELDDSSDTFLIVGQDVKWDNSWR